MITRSLSRLKTGERRSSERWGQGTRVSSPATAGPVTQVRGRDRPLYLRGLCLRREQAERVRQASNYWSSTTNANNSNNAWNVNFNNGNVNNDNKNNNNLVTAVRGGS
jgi:hypothetical protein